MRFTAEKLTPPLQEVQLFWLEEMLCEGRQLAWSDGYLNSTSLLNHIPMTEV